MRDHQRRGGSGQRRDRRQRHLRAGKTRQIELRQDRGVALILRQGLQHHAILVCLPVNGRYLPLRERVVQRIIDALEADAELARARAIDVKRGSQTALLRFRRDILKQRITTKFGNELAGPLGNLGGIGPRQGVLVLRAARLRADLDVLHRLKINRHPRDRGYALLQARNDDSNIVAALAPRPQRHHQAPDIRRGIHGTGADDGYDSRHIRIFLDCIGRLGLATLHFGERHVRSGLCDRRDGGRILERQKSLRRDDVKDQRRGDGCEGNKQCRTLAPKHPQQAPAVELDHPIGKAAGPGQSRNRALVFGTLQKTRAHHRRQSQRYDGRCDDRDGQRHGKFAEHPPDQSGHEQKRDEHRDQRDRQRDHGEADLPRAPQ